ncbi:MAG TPA: S9 family peptidase [Acidobacteriaceae bacterium]|jgi:dipeptidyl aminopeptidase/acylaminoacyl peptidase
MQKRFAVYGWLGVALLAATAVPAQQPTAAAVTAAKHPFRAQDWSALRSAHVAAVAPDGTILYRVTFGGDKGPTHTEWWTIAADGTRAAKLELQEDFSPMGFTADGHSLYGAWKVKDQRQLAVFPVTDHKAAAVPSTVVLLPRGIASATASPDGKHFAVVGDPRNPDPLGEVRHVQEPGESSLYIVNVDGTGGGWWCSNLQSVDGTVAWSADGSTLAVLSPVPHIGHHEVATAIDICSAKGAQHVTDIPNSVSGIAWTDGGKELAFLSTKSETLTPEHVWTVPASGGNATDRTPDLRGTAVGLAGDTQGRVWVAVAHGVQSDVEEFRDGALVPVYRWNEGTILDGVPAWSVYPHTSEQMALTVEDPNHAPNVAVPDGDHLRKITTESDAQLAAVALGPARVVRWKSKDGIALEGIATFPVGYMEGKKYPYLVFPHGGPEANDQLGLDPLARIIAGQGYVVLQPQYRGSTGYGAEFLAAIYQHFGDRAYQDVDSATDYAIAQGWADPQKLAIFGWSAGGFMTSWTVTQTKRYRAAIEGAGITDWAPFLFTSDLPQVDYDARWPEDDPQVFRKFSAVAFANQVTTPLLILHGEADQRVPTFQGTEFFQLLADRHKTVRMVTYPGSPHFPVLWEQRLNVMQEVTDWLKKYNGE